MYSPNQIREGIKKFAQECDTPSEFETIVREVLNEGQDGKPKPVQQGIPGVHPGTDKGVTLLADNFYSALAENTPSP